MIKAGQLVDALDDNLAICFNGDDGTHLLQDGDEVHDFRLNGGTGQLGLALGTGGRQQNLLGGTDGGVFQVNLGTLETISGAFMEIPVGKLFNLGAKLFQHTQVPVDGAVTNLATTQVGNEGFPDSVQQGAAEQNRNTGVACVYLNVGVVSYGDIRGVHAQFASLHVVVHRHTVRLYQVGNNLHVLDLGNVTKHRGGGTQQGGNHGLGDQVLSTADVYLALQRGATFNTQCADHVCPIVKTIRVLIRVTLRVNSRLPTLPHLGALVVVQAVFLAIPQLLLI